MAISQHGTSVLFTSHPKDGLVVNLYIPHNRRTPLQAEEALGSISIPRGSRGVDTFQRTCVSRAEKSGAYSTPGTPSGRGCHDITAILLKVALNIINQTKPSNTSITLRNIGSSICSLLRRFVFSFIIDKTLRDCLPFASTWVNFRFFWVVFFCFFYI